MWSKIKPILGVLLILGSLNGARLWIMGDDRGAARDLKAIGTIVSLEEKKLRITRLATKTDHYITYSFRAHDGETYSKHFSISPEEYVSLRKGQKVEVLYHSNNPSINAVPSLRAYTSVAQVNKMSPNSYPAVRAVGLLGFLLLGVYLVWSWHGGGTVSVPAVNLRLPSRSQKPGPPAAIPSERMAVARRPARPVRGRIA